MGLDTTHDCFHGSYGAFMRFRMALAEAAGIGYRYSGALVYVDVDDDYEDVLVDFLLHSDCDGEIAPEVCKPLADRLMGLLPSFPEKDSRAFGHLSEGLRAVTKQFAEGLYRAAEAGEPVEFW